MYNKILKKLKKKLEFAYRSAHMHMSFQTTFPMPLEQIIKHILKPDASILCTHTVTHDVRTYTIGNAAFISVILMLAYEDQRGNIRSITLLTGFIIRSVPG